MWKGGRQRAKKMKQREAEGGIVWKMRNQKKKKDLATHSNLGRKKV